MIADIDRARARGPGGGARQTLRGRAEIAAHTSLERVGEERRSRRRRSAAFLLRVPRYVFPDLVETWTNAILYDGFTYRE